MSLLLGEGHEHAQLYAIGRLLDEHEIVAERLSHFEGRQTVLIWNAVSAIPRFGMKRADAEKGHKNFLDFVKSLFGDKEDGGQS